MKVLLVLATAVLCLFGDLVILMSVFDWWRNNANTHLSNSPSWTYLIAAIVSACVFCYMRFKDSLKPVLRVAVDGCLIFMFIAVWREFLVQLYDTTTSWIVIAPASLLLAYYIQYRNDLRANLQPRRTAP